MELTGRIKIASESQETAGLIIDEHVNTQGRRLFPGDVLSLGAMGTFRPAEAGRTITVRYTGLPGGNSEAVVTFR